VTRLLQHIAATRPEKFMKTAKALDLTVPRTVLARADRILD